MPIGLLVAVAIAVSPPQGGVLAGETAQYEALVAGQVRAADKNFTGSDCPGSKVEVVSVIPVKVVDQPELIAWRQKVRVTGCGHSSIENINVGRIGGAPPWRMKTGLPGETYTDMTFQSSVVPLAIDQARGGLPAGCQTVTLGDVYVAARPGGIDVLPPGAHVSPSYKGRPQIVLPDTVGSVLDKLDLPAAWMEVWPFEGCGHDRTLGAVFVPLKDRSHTLHLFIPVWQQVDAHGSVERPNPAPPEE
jgi:hypothetical protein